MRNLRPITAALLVIWALQACNHGATGTAGKADSDTLVTAQDTSTVLNLTVDKDDSEFATKAASGGMAEVELGKLAIQNGKSKKVKNFGVMMIKDHGKANTKLMALAQAKKINLPATPADDEQKIITTLSQKTGAEFDKAYINAMIEDHENDIAEFTKATKNVQDPDLKNFAIKTLPVLQKHLDAINAIHDSMDK